MPELKTRVLNFFAGPGAGKSTTKAGTFFKMKVAGWKAAQIEEYATERSFEQDWESLGNQLHITSEQDRRQRRLVGKVNWIVTDSPLVLGCMYAQGLFASSEYYAQFWSLYNAYNNVNIWVDRVKPYELYGRHHSELEARDLDLRLKALAEGLIDFTTPGNEEAPDRVMAFLKERYKV